jgi:integrase/recombinase XerD
MRVQGLIDEYLQHTEDHHKEATLRHYRGRLKKLGQLLGHKKLKKLKPRDLDDYIRVANVNPKTGEPWAPDTCRSNITVLDQVLKFALRRGYLKKPIIEKFERPAGRQRERLMTEEEHAAILAIAPRDFGLIYRGLKQSGARPGELCSAKIEDIDRENSVIELQDHKTATKTRKSRLIPVGEKFAAVIQEAIGDRLNGSIFLREFGVPWKPQWLSRKFRELRDRAGLPGDLCLYLARHSFATAFYEATEDIKATADQLGHSNIQTTLRYVKRNKKLLSKNQDRV